MFIGEAPGFHEDQQGRPFVGRAGQLLDELLATVPLRRKDVYITNVIKCRPPANRDPLPQEVAACRPYLESQINLLNPKVIVTLGRHSLMRFFPDARISREHGRIMRWHDRIVFPLYHPAAALRSTTLRATLESDIRRIPEALLASLGGGHATGVSESEPAYEADDEPGPDEVREKQLSLF